MNLTVILPELYFLGTAFFFFVLSLGGASPKRDQRAILFLSAVGICIAALALNERGELFYKAYRVDGFSQMFKLVIAIGFFLVAYLGRGLRGLEEKLYPEYYMFLALSTSGLMLLVSSVELLTIFVALEMSSYSLYVVIPFRNSGERTQMEAAIKYVLFGAAATGIMLFGMSYVFGVAHTTYVAELAVKMPDLMGQPIAIVGVALMMGGFFFKLGLFPFHFWLPDVYEGTSNETAAFVATMPKIAAVALLLRLVSLAGSDSMQLVNFLMIIAAASMTYGNLAALVQKDIKRILAYSSIAHAGYVLVGVLSLNALGFAAAVYHIGGYVLMSLACFLVVCKLSQAGENVTLDGLKGLHQRSPLLAFTLAVGSFALAGIPPFVGFTGKFFLLSAALKEGYLGLVIIAALNTAISIYYYLNMVRVAYASDPDGLAAVRVDGPSQVLGYALIIAIILMGVLPDAFVAFAKTAVAVVL
ncbi:MAG: NADH-quinone oxidoreductase subunit N [Pseudomonadota bacterium]